MSRKKEINIPVNITGKVCTNGAEIRVGENYNGSGEQSFGGFGKWPAVTLRMGLPAGQYDLADTFADKLEDFVKTFVKEHELLEDKTIRTTENAYKRKS